MLAIVMPLLIATSSVDARCQPGADAAAAQLQTADRAIHKRDLRVANGALDAALHALGDAYAPPETNDDTGMHLVVAGAQQREGRLRAAVEIKRRVLVERLQLCRLPSQPRR